MAYKSTRRHWVKLWVSEWLDGTTRFELTAEQRLLWIDLLALAGRSRFPGMIYAGVGEGDKKVGYPLAYLAGILSYQPTGLKEALSILERHHHIEICESAPECFVLSIVNWDKYQSEYQRQKASRKDVTANVRTKTRQSAPEVTTQSTLRLPVEEEVEGEGEKEGEKRQRRDGAASASAIEKSFFALGHKPFGPKRFQELWAEEWSTAGTDPVWTDVMEQTIQRSKSLGVTVPGLFFQHKHQIERGEVEMRYKVTPL